MRFCQIWLKIWNQTQKWLAFLKLLFAIFTLKVQIIYGNTIIFLFFFLKMSVLLIHPHLPHLFYNIAIVIKTPTTMNNKFQALNAPKINIYIFISSFFTHTLFSFQFISYFIQILIHDKTFEDFSKTSL